MAAVCAIDSMTSTPGMSGVPGKWPWKNSSPTVTFFTATTRSPGVCSVTASMSGDGYRYVSRPTSDAMSIDTCLLYPHLLLRRRGGAARRVQPLDHVGRDVQA